VLELLDFPRVIQNAAQRREVHPIPTYLETLARELFLDHGYLSRVDRLLRDKRQIIFYGPPGTGKTRLVRAILAALSRRKGDSARVLYTADRRTLENDEIFVEFITGSHEAFVVEDADHVLAARSDGNAHLHRFLAVADGVVRALGRKIIFTTNLHNVGDIDEALLRATKVAAARSG
jgi:SpoVK/Ycf46/Vps4 family AAA+-type ATPase